MEGTERSLNHMEFKKLLNRAIAVRNKYTKLELKTVGRAWGASEHTQGFMADAGELMKLVMAKNGLRNIDDIDVKLSHELSDCLWSILIIADELGIDIEKEFSKNMDDLEKNIDDKSNTLAKK
jgi:NTP pyrophosphatase (non-canonical NTP hydrolase)